MAAVRVAQIHNSLWTAPPSKVRIVACGALPGRSAVCEAIRLSGKVKPSILYIGAATYDATLHREVQSFFFRLSGCQITSLPITASAPGLEEMRTALESADVVFLSYGNTLFASDRIKKVGLDVLLREAAANGTVIIGGSAGAILSFDGGHSDSMNPAKARNSSMGSFIYSREWEYIRAPGLGFQPGFICPHHDTKRWDGVYRADDFEQKVRAHAGEHAIGIDEQATLVIDGDAYRILTKPSSRGSVGPDGSFVYDSKGRAGVWKYKISADGAISRTVAPTTGHIADLVRPSRWVIDDPLLAQARHENPGDGKKMGWNFSCFESHASNSLSC